MDAFLRALRDLAFLAALTASTFTVIGAPILGVSLGFLGWMGAAAAVGCAGLPLYLSRVRGLTDRSPGKVLLLTTWACGLFLLAFALFAGFTVGVFYLPAAASLLLVGLVSLIRSIIMGDSDDAPSRDPDTLG